MPGPVPRKQSFWDNPANNWVAIPILLVALFVVAWGITRFISPPSGPTAECHRGMNVTDDCDY
jgi:hypothetical protein